MDKIDPLTEALIEETVIDPGVRAGIVARLPDTWTEKEINHFIQTYYGNLPEELVNVEGVVETAATATQLVEKVDESTLAISSQSRKGLTLDSYIVVDGRSIPLRSIADAGQLQPVRTLVMEGSKKFPVQRVLYSARILDRPRILTITEETFKYLSNRYPNVLPHDEPLTALGIKNVQAKTKVLTADTMERKLPS